MVNTIASAAKLLRLVALASLIGFGGFSSAAEAQILDQAYVSVPYEQQQTMEWCWVASARMVASYYNKATPPQCAMLQAQYGAPCCMNPGQMCTVPGTIWQIQQLIQSFGLKTSMIGPPTNGYVLLNLFKQGRPIVIHLAQGHFVVAAGIKVVQSQIGPLGIVRILDPFFGVQDVPLPDLYTQWDAAVYVF
jgi:ABC-type bacteriocin/lantibiotic exporter with double-glycine peptidase domain